MSVFEQRIDEIKKQLDSAVEMVRDGFRDPEGKFDSKKSRVYETLFSELADAIDLAKNQGYVDVQRRYAKTLGGKKYTRRRRQTRRLR